MSEEAELEPRRKHRRLARHEGYLAGKIDLNFACMEATRETSDSI